MLSCDPQAPAFFEGQAGVLTVTCYDLPSGTQSAFVYSTQDGGATWQTEPVTGAYQSAEFLNAEVGWVLTAPDPNAEGPRDLFTTQNAGETLNRTRQVNWTAQFSFVSPQLGWAVAQSAEGVALVKTTDGGRTWTEIRPVVSE